MATYSTEFIPELWSQQLIETMKTEMIMSGTPKRDKFSQMLRDKALGHPEYPPAKNRTATEIKNAQDHWADSAAYGIAVAIDRDILNKLCV